MSSREEIVWVYIEEFEPFINAEAYGEHPKVGRVYRGVYDTKHKIYKIAFYDELEEREELESTDLGGILIPKLQQENTAWRYKIIKLDESNINDLNSQAISLLFL